ncbi:glycosyltransferase family 2 protein [Amycolatopsis alba]|uniref:N-acetyl-glucosamine transferase n=1 Tax=Amycolatopsis alba DSM 44262 TaxID=1125972 RepID=A0A229S1X6_AMYAL|nr:glycosyltransferase [Amycolatopsis alba]OXM52917.1 N-acetyl-glucosamine transferase [Amycolatopsis alba DSM 44262]
MTNPAFAATMMLLLLWWPAHNILLAAFAWRTGRPRRAVASRGEGLEFWIVIPALNEERVVGNTVRNALSLGTERNPVRVLVIDDGSDDGTPDVLREVTDPRLHVLRRELPHARQGKGEALNAGYRYILRLCEAEGSVPKTIVGIIDGDGRGSQGMLREVADVFGDRGVGAVQCRVRIHNRRSVLALLQDLEFGAVADASQSLRDLAGSVGMGGNGQFSRLGVLRRFDPAPWSDCLVEDLELGLRLHVAGIRMRYVKSAWVTQQGLVDLRRLLRQRTRWAQGNLQCARHLRKLLASRHVGSIGLLDFLAYLVTPWLTVPLSLVVSLLFAGTLVASWSGVTLGGLIAPPSALPGAALIGVAVLLVPGVVWAVVHRLRLGEEPLHRCLLAGLLYPGFLVLGVIATWRALFRVLARRNSWTKTERLSEDEGVPAGAA